MYVGINMKFIDKFLKSKNTKTSKLSAKGVSNPIADSQDNEFLNHMSKHALDLYEKKCDIKNFTKLALSNPENTSHNQLVEQLLKDGVFDPLEDSVIEELSKNKKLLDDLDL